MLLKWEDMEWVGDGKDELIERFPAPMLRFEYD